MVDISVMARQLASIDDLDQWAESIPMMEYASKKACFMQAQPLWIERMVTEGKLMLHPEVIETLRRNRWKPADNHLQMIWASLLGTRDSSDSREYFQRIKKKLIAKYGRDWWEEVYLRKDYAYAANARIKKNIGDMGAGMQMMARKSVFMGSIVADEYRAALEMIPKD